MTDTRAAESADVLFRTGVGGTKCARWSTAASEVAFEHCPPLQPFPVRRGRRLAPGWWWSARTGRLVPYGSAAMRLHVMLLDRDPRISGLAARPLQLQWPGPGGLTAHAPQLMLRLADGQRVLADCTSRTEFSQGQRSLAQLMDELCVAVGWRYWVLGPVSPLYRRNVAWLSGYRHPRYRGGAVVDAALQEAFAEPTPLVEGADGFSNSLLVMPAVFNALWSGRLLADLDAAMHEQMLVWSPR
ncbi:TnsA-like heteromeric transposase endonuclease subunit [Streptomyces sp. NPDC014806]|uniref:TnsA-like heteromeric transposase endonuclease subunit n=1 Tax=Streptomyces sp. NPDC014806 TaxID=3364920 RepID=UPI003701452B